MGDRDGVMIRGRLRRRNLWLGIGLSIHAAGTVVILLAVVDNIVRPMAVAAATVVLAVLPPLLAVWFERRTMIRDRPAQWLRRAAGVTIPHAVAFGLTTSTMLAQLPWPVRVSAPLLLVVAQAGCVTLASRAVRYPLTPELGGMRVEVEVKIRSAENGPVWASQHDVRLTEKEIITTVRPGISYGLMTSIPLETVTSVVSRSAHPRDSPWYRLPDGTEYPVIAGEVLDVRYPGGSAVLPVYDAAAFAEVIRSRLESGSRPTG